MADQAPSAANAGAPAATPTNMQATQQDAATAAARVTPASVSVLAESVLGGDVTRKLSAEAASVLAPDVEYRLRALVQDASKFMRHAKRTKLTCSDVNNALLARGCEPVYGFEDGARDASRFVEAAGHPHVFYVQDAVLDLASFVSRPLPRAIPREPALATHYLAVNGVQPKVPQNAVPSAPTATAATAAAASTAVSAAAAAAAAATTTTTAAAAATTAAVTTAVASQQQPQQVLPAVQGPSESLPALAHHVPKELQVYLDKVTASLGDAQSSAETNSIILQGLRTDSAIDAIVPYLVRFVCDRVKAGISGTCPLATVQAVLDAAENLLGNTHVDLEPYLHQLSPAVLSCVCAKNLGTKREAKDSRERGDDVRKKAAKLAASLCERFGDNPRYALRMRMAQTYAAAMADAKKAASARCGALWGLHCLGKRVLHATFLPRARALSESLPDNEAFSAALQQCAGLTARFIESAWPGVPPHAKAPDSRDAWDAALTKASRTEPGTDAPVDGATLGILNTLFDLTAFTQHR